MAVPAAAGPALLVDPTDGRVFYAEDQDRAWHPASLTKMMTAYLTYEAVKAGRLAWDTTVRISPRSAAQPKTRAGVRAGQEIRLDIAVQALMIASANDLAVALAETVGGDYDAFIAQMNATATRLGMQRTLFKNPHGLPDPEQRTTARDMAILALALLKEFPEHKPTYAMTQLAFGKRTLGATNGLLMTFAGTDGLKTGFTCASGYNVVVTAKREGRSLLAVVLGEANRDMRADRAVQLLEFAFGEPSWSAIPNPLALTRLPLDPEEEVDPHDLTKDTRTWQCGTAPRPRKVRKRGGPRKVAGKR